MSTLTKDAALGAQTQTIINHTMEAAYWLHAIRAGQDGSRLGYLSMLREVLNKTLADVEKAIFQLRMEG